MTSRTLGETRISTAAAGETDPRPVDRLLSPSSVAVIGASSDPRKVGSRCVANLIASGFDGGIYPVNPQGETVHGVRGYRSVGDLPTVADLAIVCVPGEAVVEILTQCGEAGIRDSIVFSSGFAETGPRGADMQAQIAHLSRTYGLRILGPNCAGVFVVGERRALCFSPVFKPETWLPGPVAVVVQGGGLGAAIWAAADHGLGLSWLISTGNEASLEVSDFVAHLAGDDRTSVIALILENVKVGERFKKSVAKARDAGKTILAVRVGRTSAGERAAALHTGVIAGPDRMYDAVFAELGIQRCRDIEHMTTLATLLTRYDRPAADGVGIVTFSGGSGALTADCFAYQGIAIPEPGEETKASLTTLMASYANASNPLDTTTAVYGDPDAFSETLKLLADDERYGAIVVPVPFYYPILIDRLLLAVERAAQTRSKPIIPLWLGQGNEPPSLRALEQAGIVVLRNLSTAAVALGDFLDAPKARSVDRVMVSREVEEAVAHLRALASRQQAEFIAEYQLKKVLAVAGMKAPAEDLATTADEAVLIAGEFDGPVALKVVSSQIAHKMRVGGVRLGVIGRDRVRAAFEDITTAVNRALDHPMIDGILVQEMVTGPELMVGLEVDPTWGTMVVLGLGGPYAEHIHGHAIRSAPLDMETALDMVGTAPIADVVDNSPCSREAVAALLVNVSCLVDKASGLVSGVDLNPVVLTPGGVRVIDAVAHLRGHAHAPD